MRISDWSSDVCSSDLSAIAKQALEKLESDLISGAILSGVFALAALVFAWFYFTRTGKGLGSNEYLRGAHFGTVRQVRRALRRETKGSFSIDRKSTRLNSSH